MECLSDISKIENIISTSQNDMFFIGIMLIGMAFIIGVMFEKIQNGEKLIWVIWVTSLNQRETNTEC